MNGPGATKGVFITRRKPEPKVVSLREVARFMAEQGRKYKKPPVVSDQESRMIKKKNDKKWKKDHREEWLKYKREWNKKRRAKIYREITKLQKQIDVLRSKI